MSLPLSMMMKQLQGVKLQLVLSLSSNFVEMEGLFRKSFLYKRTYSAVPSILRKTETLEQCEHGNTGTSATRKRKIQLNTKEEKTTEFMRGHRLKSSFVLLFVSWLVISSYLLAYLCFPLASIFYFLFIFPYALFHYL